MSESNVAGANPERDSAPDRMAALFAQLILQQTNMAMMLLGKIAHPESGQVYKDVEAARLFIDQMEMLDAKTKGNLSKEESALLKQSLMSLRMAFVEAVEESETKPESKAPPVKPSAPAAEQPAGAPAESATASEEEHKKKFSKKY